MSLPSSLLDAIFVFCAIVCSVVLLFSSVQFWKDFQRELRYINMEIQRNGGAEQERWKKKRKELWLSLILFYRTK